jgi:serine/threonine protein kinase
LFSQTQARWCRVADFGLATTRVESSTSTTSTIRNTNNVWRAPELLLKPGAKFTKESDVWSYGCVLYEIATGSVPWAGVSLDEVKSFYREKTCLEIPEEVDSQFAVVLAVRTQGKALVSRYCKGDWQLGLGRYRVLNLS